MAKTAKHGLAFRASPQTSQEFVVEWLREAVISRKLQPGRRVGQEEIAEQVGVSIVPVREAFRVLEQEGQLTYRPRRGHFVTELRIQDLEEIYALRELLEERAVRHSVERLKGAARARIIRLADECRSAQEARDVLAELRANREFHFAIMDVGDLPHTLKMIHNLWDKTAAYRAIYYNSPAETAATVEAHDRMIELAFDGRIDELIVELADHRNRALGVLRGILQTS